MNFKIPFFTKTISNIWPVKPTFNFSINQQLIDASGFRIGVFDLAKSESYSRQMGWKESGVTDICGYEAKAVEMCVLNIDLNKRPTKIRFLNLFSRNFLLIKF